MMVAAYSAKAKRARKQGNKRKREREGVREHKEGEQI